MLRYPPWIGRRVNDVTYPNGGDVAPQLIDFTMLSANLSQPTIGTVVHDSGSTTAAQGDYLMPADGYVQMRITTGESGQFLQLSDTSGLAVDTASTTVFGVNPLSGTYQTYAAGLPGYVNSGIAYADGHIVRLRRTGSTGYAEYSDDEGATWNAIHTFASTNSDPLYVKVWLGAFAAREVAGIPRTTEPPLLILFGWESNSGGVVPDALASAGEKTESTGVQTLNPTTLVFEPLHVGVNNNLEHADITPATTHGWHVGLKNQTEAGALGATPVFMCECGQGSSAINDWADGGAYDVTATARIEAAISGVISETSRTPRVVMWVSFGLNDWVESTTAAAYKAGLIALLDRYVTDYGVIHFYMDNIPASTEYRTAITEVATERDDVTVQDMVGLQFMDIYHLGYTGMKDMVALKISDMSI